ncbi:KOW domain-containing RNA-binding protein [Thermoflavimicrobium daqui]|jgi:ribosomal protein L14E/L6E/L27E|uniref:RNA-binding protein n=1 Tax=Thermoflavimicrobium daqui TaxID=2137476 RepID=A0A364K3D8_9BACL|nr:KOW domain-containing RNA-binding protein [Thermoflavimicrobium daqui]RAL23278.1 RNA-binding protein [Thermoflavimicrobium daqui]
MDVTVTDNHPKLGQIVQVLRGRIAGSYAIVIDFEEPHFVWLADGDQRKADRPKKKNVKHIQPTRIVVEEIARVLKDVGRVPDAMLRYALNQYLLQQNSEQKGE